MLVVIRMEGIPIRGEHVTSDRLSFSSCAIE